jgi:hypothetical protein
LRDEKTVELTALTVQIEQTILDLNREARTIKPGIGVHWDRHMVVRITDGARRMRFN